jgi:Flp pilus assembly protein TadD
MRLNLAVGLMRLGNWPGALAELSKVQLPAGPGVSTGTVQYLLGLSYEALGQAAEAERAFRAAADTASLLTEDGPAVKELAERKLARGRR